jgi:hypothetical protein
MEDVKKMADDDDAADSRKRKREGEEEDDAAQEGVKKEEEEEEEAALLESALDTIEGHKTREEAEIDRQKLLAGDLLGHGEEEAADQGDTAASAAAAKNEKPERKLTKEEREAEILKRSGLVIVSDDEVTVLGGNRILPWRHGYKQAMMAGVKKEEPADDKKEGEDTKPKPPARVVRTAIKFKTKFDVVELDASGRVIDKGKTP